MASWTTADLLNTVLNRQMFPTASTGSLSPLVLLQFATEELYITLLPAIMSARAKYYETTQDTLITDLTPTIAIPSRAVNGAISAVQYTFGDDVCVLNPIDAWGISTTTPNNFPTNYYFQNNTIYLYPPPTGTNGTLTLRYFQRPSRLALISDCAQITAYNSETGVATFSAVPSTWTTSDLFDFVPQVASQATPYGINSAISAISGTTITFSSSPTGVNVGDWIALAEYTPIPEIPFEFQAVLAQATAVKALEAINDPIALPIAQSKLNAYLQSMVQSVTPRDQTGLKKVVSGWRTF